MIATCRPTKRSAAVAEQRARQQVGLGQHLEAVADPEDEAAFRRERRHGPHHRAEPGDHAGPQVVAVGEAAGDQDRRDAVERDLLVPQLDRLGARDPEAVERVDVAVRAREDHDADADAHAGPPTSEDVAPSSSTS